MSYLPPIATELEGAPPPPRLNRNALPPGFAGGPNIANRSTLLLPNNMAALAPVPANTPPASGTEPSGGSVDLGTRPTLDPAKKKAYDDLTAQLTSTPEPTLQQAQYQAPKPTASIIAGLASLLFPGSGLSTLARGYAAGQQQGAEKKYEREQQKDDAQYQAAMSARADEERRQEALGNALDRQQREIDAWDYHQQTLQEKSQEATEKAREAAARITQSAERIKIAWKGLGLRQDNYDRLVAKDRNQIALALAIHAMSDEQSQQRLAQAARIAALDEYGRNARFSQDQQFISARAKISEQNQAVQKMIAAETNPLNGDSEAVKKAKIQQWMDKLDSTYSSVMAPLEAKHPEFMQIGDSLSDAAYATDDESTRPGSTSSIQQLYREYGGGAGPGSLPVQTSTGNPPNGRATPPPPSLLTPMQQLMQRVGATPDEARILAVIGANESGGDPNAVNPAGTGVGLWQINPKAHGSGDWTNPLTNAKEALNLYRTQGLQPWTDSRDKGAYGGWGPFVSPPPGPGSPGSALEAYLRAHPAPGQLPSPGAQSNKGATPAARPGAQPEGQQPNAPPAKPVPFVDRLNNTLALIRQNPKAFDFNRAEEAVRKAYTSGQFTQAQRDQFLTAMTATYKQLRGEQIQDQRMQSNFPGESVSVNGPAPTAPVPTSNGRTPQMRAGELYSQYTGGRSYNPEAVVGQISQSLQSEFRMGKPLADKIAMTVVQQKNPAWKPAPPALQPWVTAAR